MLAVNKQGRGVPCENYWLGWWPLVGWILSWECDEEEVERMTHGQQKENEFLVRLTATCTYFLKTWADSLTTDWPPRPQPLPDERHDERRRVGVVMWHDRRMANRPKENKPVKPVPLGRGTTNKNTYALLDGENLQTHRKGHVCFRWVQPTVVCISVSERVVQLRRCKGRAH